MFSRFYKTLDAITIYHSPKDFASQRMVDILKTHNEKAVAGAFHDDQPDKKFVQFELEVVEAPAMPTPEQLKTICEYVGPEKIGTVIHGATGVFQALKGLKDPNSLTRPLVVDWNNGKVVVGPITKELHNMLKSLPDN